MAKHCWSGLTYRHPDDEWQLSIFMAWYRSISFLQRVLLGVSAGPLEEIFQVTKPRWKTKQCTWVLAHNGEKTHSQTCVSADELCHAQLCLFSTGHMEMSLPPKRCSLMSGHVAGMDPGHTYTLSSCVRDCWPTPPRVPPPASTPRRETNCESYWLPRQICAVQRVNKMDGVVRLSSGKVFWQHASGRVQHSPG